MADQNVVSSKEMSEIVYGVLFDFMGYCTTRQKPLILSVNHNCVPVIESINKFLRAKHISNNEPNFNWAELCAKDKVKVSAKQVDEPLQAQTDELIHMTIINNMSQYDMCFLWRFAKLKHIYLDRTLPYYKVFKDRLFNHFDGFSPEINKQLGH